MAVLQQQLVGLEPLLLLPLLLLHAQPVVLMAGDALAVRLYIRASERRYSTHTGKSSGPLTGEASMLSRPA